MLRGLFAPLAAVLLTLAACSGGSDGDPGAGPGVLLIARPEGIVEFDIETRTEQMLLPPAVPGAFMLDPALSPEADRIAYVVQPPTTIDDGVYDAGSDLWIADRDGANARPAFEHDTPSQLVRFPRWLDGDTVLAIVQEIVEEAGNARIVYELQQIEVDGGARTTVLSDVLAFTVAPNGDRIAYAALAEGTGEVFRVAALSGEDGEVLVGPDANLAPFQSPEYSPDGEQIAFASADQTLVVRAGRLASLGRDTGPWTDGLPEDIWIIDAGGGPARRVADLKEDLPALTWNGDGSHIYVLGSAGLYDIDLATGATETIGEGAFHGQIEWVPGEQ